MFANDWLEYFPSKIIFNVEPQQKENNNGIYDNKIYSRRKIFRSNTRSLEESTNSISNYTSILKLNNFLIWVLWVDPIEGIKLGINKTRFQKLC